MVKFVTFDKSLPPGKIEEKVRAMAESGVRHTVAGFMIIAHEDAPRDVVYVVPHRPELVPLRDP